MAKNSKRKPSAGKKARYAMYEDARREEKNRIAKLVKHVKKFPNDMVAFSALKEFKKSGVPHRRKTRRVGIQLTDNMKNLLRPNAGRLSSHKVALYGLLRNPAKRRPAFSENLDKVMNIMKKHRRLPRNPAMAEAFRAAKYG